MPNGDSFSPAQSAELSRSLAQAKDRSGLEFTLYVGPLADGRTSAEQMHAAVAEPAVTVLVAVDPAGRDLEIVTGDGAARHCDERACALAAVAMTTSFAAGDLVGGIKNGLQLLGEHGRRPALLHTETL